MRRSNLRRMLLAVPAAVWGLAGSAQAGPWLEAGDERLRHDLQALADSGAIHLPSQSWPVPAADVSHALDQVSYQELGTPVLERALTRARTRLRRESRAGRFESHVGGSLTANPGPVRGFGGGPREDLELEAGVERMGQRWSGRLQLQWVPDPEDDQDFRFDGSYAGGILGNWMVSLDTHERWWGPGWDGSLILSDHARPFPRLSLQRNYADAPESPWLAWLGPWRLSAFLGQLEQDREVSSPLVFGTRLDLAPLPTLQLGLSTVAMLGGSGRDDSLGALLDVYEGSDTDDPADAAGMHISAVDARYALPGVPAAIYGQLAQQAPEGGSPEDTMALYGLETTLSLGAARSVRLFLEHADLTGTSEAAFGRYEAAAYGDGYTYYGRTLGHALAGEGELTTLGALYLTPEGNTWDARLRSGERRVGAGGAAFEDYTEVELGYTERLADGTSWGGDAGWREHGAWPLHDETDGEWYLSVHFRQAF